MREVIVGDYVRCIVRDFGTSDLTYGRRYLVLSLGISLIGDSIYYVINNEGVKFGYYGFRFELDIIYIRELKLKRLGCLSSVVSGD